MKFQEFPKWIIHPETGETLVVDDANAEEKQMSDWGFVPAEEPDDLPQIDLGNKPVEDLKEPAPEPVVEPNPEDPDAPKAE